MNVAAGDGVGSRCLPPAEFGNGRTGEPELVVFGHHLGQVLLVEANVATPGQGNHPFPNRARDGVRRLTALVPMDQRPGALDFVFAP